MRISKNQIKQIGLVLFWVVYLFMYFFTNTFYVTRYEYKHETGEKLKAAASNEAMLWPLFWLSYFAEKAASK